MRQWIGRTGLGVLLSLVGLIQLGADAAGAQRVGLVIDQGGRKDRGFNAAAVEGLQKAAKSFKPLGLVTEVHEAAGTEAGAHEAVYRELAKKGFDLVIGLGATHAEGLQKVASEFPKVNFALVDAEVSAPNVRSILFKEHEGSFLVGAIAGWVAKGRKLGFIGGMDIPVIRRYEAGFAAGAKRARLDTTVQVDYIGVTSEAWSDQARAKELALAQYDKGVEIIFAASGSANLGIFEAAEARKKLAIGVSNQNHLKPGRILTSMRKRVDVAVLITCQDAAMGSFTADTKRYGLTDQAVDFVMDKHNEALIPKAVLAQAKKLREDLISGKVVAPEARAGATAAVGAPR